MSAEADAASNNAPAAEDLEQSQMAKESTYEENQRSQYLIPRVAMLTLESASKLRRRLSWACLLYTLTRCQQRCTSMRPSRRLLCALSRKFARQDRRTHLSSSPTISLSTTPRRLSLRKAHRSVTSTLAIPTHLRSLNELEQLSSHTLLVFSNGATARETHMIICIAKAHLKH